MPQAPGCVFFFADRLRSCALPSEGWKKSVDYEQCPRTFTVASQEQPAAVEATQVGLLSFQSLLVHNSWYSIKFVSIISRSLKSPLKWNNVHTRFKNHQTSEKSQPSYIMVAKTDLLGLKCHCFTSQLDVFYEMFLDYRQKFVLWDHIVTNLIQMNNFNQLLSERGSQTSHYFWDFKYFFIILLF